MGGRYGAQGPVEDDPWKPQGGYVTVCPFCRHPISKLQIGGRIDGLFTDFEERGLPEEINIEICSECKAAMREILKGGIPAAIRRMREANRG